MRVCSCGCVMWKCEGVEMWGCGMGENVRCEGVERRRCEEGDGKGQECVCVCVGECVWGGEGGMRFV